MNPSMSNFKDYDYIPILCLIEKCSHTVAYKANEHQAFEKSQHAEDFGCKKIICLLKFNKQSHIWVTPACAISTR